MSHHRVRNAVILGAVALIGLAAALWFLILSPRLTMASEITTQAEGVAFSNRQLQQNYDHVLEEARGAPEAAKDAAKLFSTMPEQADIPAVLAQIADAASRAGIAITNIPRIETSAPVPIGAPSAASIGVNLAQMEISVEVAGTREQLLTFIDNLQALDRALLLRTSNITPAPQVKGEPPGLWGMTVTGTMFVLQSQLPDLVANVEALIELAGIEPAPVAAA